MMSMMDSTTAVVMLMTLAVLLMAGILIGVRVISARDNHTKATATNPAAAKSALPKPAGSASLPEAPKAGTPEL